VRICIADLPLITDINVANFSDPLTTMPKQDFVYLNAESGITYEERAHISSPSMLHN
jgi:hypothetical protein